MFAIELFFPAGRFHATPWGRHVNEGAPEWPPSPFRLVRALYDAWKRKQPAWPAERVEPLLAALAASPPSFHLPPASPSHTRAFLSQNLADPTKRQLIFDGFVALDPGAPVLMVWPDMTLEAAASDDLQQLLRLINYLGRSESWVTARLLPDLPSVSTNCRPAEIAGEARGMQLVPVACALPCVSYQANPYIATGSNGARKKKLKDSAKAVSWMDALAWSTSDVLASRRSEPPALRFVPYRRSIRCFEITFRRRASVVPPQIHGVLFALESKVPPSVVSTLLVAERVRRKLMGIHKALVGDPRRVSPRFSGKDAFGHPLEGHQHAYLLPQDRDEDGLLDHLLVLCNSPLQSTEQLALDRLEGIWQSHGKPDVRLVPIRWGTKPQLLTLATRFTSATPLVLTRHYRRGRGEFGQWLAEEVCRELDLQGLPPPLRVRLLSRLLCKGGRSHRWLEFRRNRKEDQLRPGYGFELEFAEPVAGPFALGYGCHFGLGLFVPQKT